LGKSLRKRGRHRRDDNIFKILKLKHRGWNDAYWIYIVREGSKGWLIWTGQWIFWFHCLVQVVPGEDIWKVCMDSGSSETRENISWGLKRMPACVSTVRPGNPECCFSVAAYCFIPEWFRGWGDFYFSYKTSNRSILISTLFSIYKTRSVAKHQAALLPKRSFHFWQNSLMETYLV